jgi:MSHA biogenesis protein MshN
MLQDLEARRSQSDEVNTDYQAPQRKQSKLLVWILLILAIAAITFALLDKNQLVNESKNTEVSGPVSAQPSPPVVTRKMAVVPKKTPLQRQANPSITSATPDKTNIELAETASKIIRRNSISAEAEISPLESNKVTKDLVSEQNNDTQNEQLETLDQTSSFSMSGSSQENHVTSLKQRIAESLDAENFEVAQSLLGELLATEPNNINARKKLASLRFAQGNYAQSKQILIQGIELHPTQSDLRLMLARLYVVQKEPSKAINILTESQPDIGKQTEYLAYRGALAQQLKQTELAKADYQRLTKIESTNAKWWLGLAIARDQLGDIDMAVQAYSKANSLGQLDGTVNDFIQKRISVLAGAQ